MGSPPSWPFMDFNNPLSCLLQEELHQPAFLGASPSPSLNPSHLLSSHASIGASTAKVSKRKSRAVNKPPIRVLSADRESFRDMVQKLTGIPTSPMAGRLWGAGNMSSSVFRPMAARPGSHQSEFLANGGAHQSMPTLDTSSAYLTRNSSNLGYNEVGNVRYKADYYEDDHTAAVAAGTEIVPCAEAPNQAVEGMSDYESFLLGGAKLEDLLQSRIDPWLTPHVEIAHSA